jgi:hypothetical protein
MIRTYAASADDHDLRAVTPPGTSLARHVLHGTIPGTLGVFGLIYVISRSLSVATLLGGCVLAASLESRFVSTCADPKSRRSLRRFGYPGAVAFETSSCSTLRRTRCSGIWTSRSRTGEADRRNRRALGYLRVLMSRSVPRISSAAARPASTE